MDNLDSFEKLTVNDMIRIADNIFGNIFVVNAEGVLVFINKNSANGLGYSREELLGMTIYELLDKGIVNRSVTDEAIKTKTQVVGYATTGQGLELGTVSTPLFDQNGNLSMVVTYSQEKPLIDTFVDKVNREREQVETYQYALAYLGEKKVKDTKIVVNNSIMKRIFQSALLIAKTDSTVVLYGESGVGKEIIARFIHRNSLRALEPLIPVNCAAIPRELMESEFFGYVKGAFTGANKEGKPGLFELANNGSLFLDEIGELPLDLQSKLLRVLETGEVSRIGNIEAPKKTNVRIIAATNRELKKMVEEKQFREDLYYRLNVIPINIPPLRERPEDICELANVFLEEFNRKYGFNKQFSQRTIDSFLSYTWPGNIRELRNIIERMVITSSSDILNVIDALEINKTSLKDSYNDSLSQNRYFQYDGNLKSVISSFEKDYILKMVEECGGKISQAAKKLEIHRSVIYRKLGNK